MNSRSYAYSRLNNGDESLANRVDASHEDDSDSASTKLRRLPLSQSRDRWPGAASHTSSFSPTDPHRDYVEHVIKPKETLQGLALIYRCTVFDLKLANNIQREAEFFARRTLRIPVRQHSSLTEKLPQQPAPSVPTPVPVDTSSSTSSSTEYLRQVDQDLQKLKEKARVYEIDGQHSSTAADLELMRRAARTNQSTCQGDDCGLSWAHILGMALLVLLACPLLYFLYLELNLHKVTSRNVSVTNGNLTTVSIPSSGPLND